jgi:hypothetical protein
VAGEDNEIIVEVQKQVSSEYIAKYLKMMGLNSTE